MAAYTCRIHRWIITGKHVFEDDLSESKATRSKVKTENMYDGSLGQVINATEHATGISPEKSLDHSKSSSESEHSKLLVGCENDLLIPSTRHIYLTFLECQSTWRAHLSCANSLPPGYLTAGSLDPGSLLQNMPPLPQDLPRKERIVGQSVWHVTSPSSRDVTKHQENGKWDPQCVYNTKKTFNLTISKPTEYQISSRSGSRFNSHQPNGIAILTSLWSYIFCLRFLEMQKRRIWYSLQRLSPVSAKDIKYHPGHIVINLGPASRKLTRWLCCVLAPGLGWFVKGPLPPWTTHYQKATHFNIATGEPFSFSRNDPPPSSYEAADLLIEFCVLFGIGSSTVDRATSFETLQQPTAAFLAALALPLYSNMPLQPQLPMPISTKPNQTHATAPKYIREYVTDLTYYMTLSMDSGSVGSVIWSIF